MRKAWRWLKRNTIITLAVAVGAWIIHRVVETAILNIGRYAGIPIPLWV